MKFRFAASVIATSLLTASAAFAQSTTATGAVNGARTAAEAAGPVGEAVGGTVGAAVGTAVEVPDAVILSLNGQQVPSVTVPERVVVGKALPPTVELWPVPRYDQYDYTVVNDRRMIVDPRTRRVLKIVD